MKLHKKLLKLFTCLTLLASLTTPVKANNEENISDTGQRIYDLSEINENEIPSIENGWIPVGTAALGVNLLANDDENLISGIIPEGTVWSVSYTHLDVYKRQVLMSRSARYLPMRWQSLPG